MQVGGSKPPFTTTDILFHKQGGQHTYALPPPLLKNFLPMAKIDQKFTPGPWYPVEYAGFYNVQLEDAYGFNNLLDYDETGFTEDEVAANASLMAAAPELLAALQGVLRVADRKTKEFDAARAAIAKATGNAA